MSRFNPTPAQGERLKADLTLLAVAAIWGTGFVTCRLALDYLGPFLYNGLRFSLAALTLLPLAWNSLRTVTGSQWRGAAVAGLLIFSASGIQQMGMQHTTAGKAGFITGLYVVLVPILLALGWRRRASWPIWAASVLAAAGLFFLSVTRPLTLGPGDGLVLVSALFWALHVIAIGQLARQIDILPLAVIQYAVCGLLSLVVGLLFEIDTAASLSTVWWVVLYNGIVSVAIGYTLQVVGQRSAPTADAAVLLSMEAVFAALFGGLFLGEMLAPRQLVGCGLMLAGMLLAQAQALVPARAKAPT